MNAGERIKGERTRLGYTQAAFAKACGVHRNTQIKYESGEREPDTSYLAAIAQIGVDVGYVLTGKSEAQERQAVIRVLALVQENLKLTKHDSELESICRLSLKDVQELWSLSDSNPSTETGLAVYNLLKKSPVVFFDLSVLEDVIEKLEFVIDTTGVALAPDEKARAITALARIQKAEGQRIDLNAVKRQLLHQQINL